MYCAPAFAAPLRGGHLSVKTKRAPQQTIAAVATALASTRDPDAALAGAAAAIGEGEDAVRVQIWGQEVGALLCRADWATPLKTKSAPAASTRKRKERSDPPPEDDPFTVTCDATCLEAAGSNGGTHRMLSAGTPAELGTRPDLRAVLDGAALVEWRASAETPESLAEVLEALGAGSVATLGIRIGDDTAGALTIARADAGSPLTAAAKKRLTLLAQLIAGPTRAATVAAAGEAALRQAGALCRAAQAVNDLVESDQAVDAVKEQIATLVGGSECKVRVFLRTQWDTYAEFPPRAGGDSAGLSETDDLTELENQAVAERRTLSICTGRAVRLATPLLLRGAPLGYLALITGRSQDLTPLEVEGVEALAQQICAALDVARLRRAVQRLTTVDTMTGLRNREFLYERLAAEIARAKRYKQPLSLILVDFDELRRFNSRHGNHEGNRFLRTAANLVKTSVRDNVDVACRYNGAEFALLLPNTLASARGAGAVAERIRKMVETMQFHDENDHKLSRMTASLGIAGYPTHAEDADELLELAAEALRAAKAAGKNRVGLYNARR